MPRNASTFSAGKTIELKGVVMVVFLGTLLSITNMLIVYVVQVRLAARKDMPDVAGTKGCCGTS